MSSPLYLCHHPPSLPQLHCSLMIQSSYWIHYQIILPRSLQISQSILTLIPPLELSFAHLIIVCCFFASVLDDTDQATLPLALLSSRSSQQCYLQTGPGQSLFGSAEESPQKWDPEDFPVWKLDLNPILKIPSVSGLQHSPSSKHDEVQVRQRTILGLSEEGEGFLPGTPQFSCHGWDTTLTTHKIIPPTNSDMVTVFTGNKTDDATKFCHHEEACKGDLIYSASRMMPIPTNQNSSVVNPHRRVFHANWSHVPTPTQVLITWTLLTAIFGSKMSLASGIFHSTSKQLSLMPLWTTLSERNPVRNDLKLNATYLIIIYALRTNSCTKTAYLL